MAINGPPAGRQEVLIRPVALLCANIIAVGILMVLHPKNLTCGVCVTRRLVTPHTHTHTTNTHTHKHRHTHQTTTAVVVWE